MIVAKVCGLPLVEEAVLKELYEKIVREFGGEIVDRVANLTQTILTAREDDSVVRVGEEIVIEISEKSGHAETLQKQIAMAFEKVARAAFPKGHGIEWSVFKIDLDRGYWPSPFTSEEAVYP